MSNERQKQQYNWLGILLIVLSLILPIRTLGISGLIHNIHFVLVLGLPLWLFAWLIRPLPDQKIDGYYYAVHGSAIAVLVATILGWNQIGDYFSIDSTQDPGGYGQGLYSLLVFAPVVYVFAIVVGSVLGVICHSIVSRGQKRSNDARPHS